jgi:hypothetical protein
MHHSDLFGPASWSIIRDSWIIPNNFKFLLARKEILLTCSVDPNSPLITNYRQAFTPTGNMMLLFVLMMMLPAKLMRWFLSNGTEIFNQGSLS